MSGGLVFHEKNMLENADIEEPEDHFRPKTF